jgi:hypothetical protein
MEVTPGDPGISRGDFKKADGARGQSGHVLSCDSILGLFYQYLHKFAFSSLQAQCIIRASTPSTFFITEKEPHSYGYG